MRFRAAIRVAAGGREADAKSVLDVMALGATGGSELSLKAEGDDAGAAVDALTACVAALAK
jgi:phosphotransferase system HPr (HPr) family protein